MPEPWTDAESSSDERNHRQEIWDAIDLSYAFFIVLMYGIITSFLLLFVFQIINHLLNT